MANMNLFSAVCLLALAAGVDGPLGVHLGFAAVGVLNLLSAGWNKRQAHKAGGLRD